MNRGVVGIIFMSLVLVVLLVSLVSAEQQTTAVKKTSLGDRLAKWIAEKLSGQKLPAEPIFSGSMIPTGFQASGSTSSSSSSSSSGGGMESESGSGLAKTPFVSSFGDNKKVWGFGR